MKEAHERKLKALIQEIILSQALDVDINSWAIKPNLLAIMLGEDTGWFIRLYLEKLVEILEVAREKGRPGLVDLHNDKYNF